MDAERRDKDGHTDPTQGGKDAKKGGKSDRPKGASPGVVVQPLQAGRQKGAQPHAGGWASGKDDASEGNEVRGKGESWKDKKDAPDRRRKQEGSGEVSTTPQVLNGPALLSLLKANPPSATRYSREELLSIGQLPPSKVKPPSLHETIDKDNVSSTLGLKSRPDKASRRRGEGFEAEEDDIVDEDGDAAHRRERPVGVGAKPDRGAYRVDSDEEKDSGRKTHTRWSDRWNQDQHTSAKEPQEPLGFQVVSAESQAVKDGWDMPDSAAGLQGNLMDFTLGDIRKAEKSLSGGMSLKDYKASLRSGSTSSGKDKEDLFQADSLGDSSSFFVDEDEEDIARASRGFGKWFAGGRVPEVSPALASTPAAASSPPSPAKGSAEADAWDAVTRSSAALPSAPPKAALPSEPAARSFRATPLPAPVAPGMISGTATSSTASVGRSGEKNMPAPAGPLGKREEFQSTARSTAHLLRGQDTTPATASFPSSEARKDDVSTMTSNSAGRSILSMLGRPSGEASAEASPPAEAKLKVSDLFNLAQGKMMPSIPPPITHQRGGAGTPATGAELEQEEALKMQLMWAAAARASSTYGGSRYPGFQQPGASSLGGVDSSGAGGGRGNMGRGQNPNAGWEAYAQAAQQAAMSMGRGGYPASSGPSPYQQQYQGSRGPGYASSYGQYGMSDDVGQLGALGHSFEADAIGQGLHGSLSGAASEAEDYSRSPFQAGLGLGVSREGAAATLASSPPPGRNSQVPNRISALESSGVEAEGDEGCAQS